MDIRLLLRSFIALTPGIVIAVMIHEFLHYRFYIHFTDFKKRELPSLGFVKRFDPLGLLMYYLFNFGWSRPYPINYWKLKRKRTSEALLTAFSGPIANFLIGFTAAVLLFFTDLNVFCTITNETPVAFPFMNYASDALYWTMVVNLNTSLFNLLPFPPLDGSSVLMILVPEEQVQWLAKYQLYGLLVLVVLSLLGIIQLIMWPITKLTSFLALVFTS
ncbi:MAG: site-2 protease family protein [Kosmotogaceae bacterium]